MFTGIVECIGIVKSIEKKGISGKIYVKTQFTGKDATAAEMLLGDSIAVNGVCLTVTSIAGGVFEADISDETLSLTNLGGLSSGARVNLERALTPLKRMGGHIVSGHIDCTGRLIGRVRKGTGEEFEFTIPQEYQRQLVRKGSVTVDGISLTIAALTDKGFTVAVIPHTIENTTLQALKTGGKVNIETDIIGKYVERFMRAGREDGTDKEGGLTSGFLAEHGFLKG